MWIMTEGGSILNAENIEAIYWYNESLNQNTGSPDWELLARTGGRVSQILSKVDADVFERESMIMRLLLAIQQGGMFTATDLYRKK